MKEKKERTEGSEEWLSGAIALGSLVGCTPTKLPFATLLLCTLLEHMGRWGGGATSVVSRRYFVLRLKGGSEVLCFIAVLQDARNLLEHG